MTMQHTTAPTPRLFSISLRIEDSRDTRLHLIGRILTPTHLIENGTLVIEGGRITSIHEGPVKAPAGGTSFDTRGTIVAGFVDAHNHPECAAVRRWVSGARFTSRAGWRGENRCREPVGAVRDPFYEQGPYRELKLLIDPNVINHAILYGQIRAVIGGATAMVMDANAPHPPLPPSSVNRGASASVMTLLDPGCLEPPFLARPVGGPTPDVVAAHLASGGRLHAHCAEGFVGDPYCEHEFDVLDRNHLLGPRTTLIHGLGLDAARLQRVVSTQTSMVWSPVSNLNLYGRTLDVQPLLASGVKVALAPDWTVSGSSTILDEARFALATYPWLQPTQVLSMITEWPAELLGLDAGRLDIQASADLVVFDGTPPSGSLDEQIRHVLSQPHEDIALVMVGGTPVFGATAAMTALGVAFSTLHVPTAAGATVARELGLPRSVLENCTHALRTALQRDPAPLWEAP